MASNIVEVEGVLREDGTLVLDKRPELPPGRVRVSIQPFADLSRTPVWQFLEKIWGEQKARGHVARSREEIDADIAAMRQEDEERMRAIEQLHEECEQARKRLPPAEAS
jgi:hypothetical protein